jgi:signal transduction histidine kinase
VSVYLYTSILYLRKFLIEINIKLLCFQSDASLLEIAWNNIITNAIKFIKPGGIVKVLLKQENYTAGVSITDSGCRFS